VPVPARRVPLNGEPIPRVAEQRVANQIRVLARLRVTQPPRSNR
jgi:hypothetical protein